MILISLKVVGSSRVVICKKLYAEAQSSDIVLVSKQFSLVTCCRYWKVRGCYQRKHKSWASRTSTASFLMHSKPVFQHRSSYPCMNHKLFLLPYVRIGYLWILHASSLHLSSLSLKTIFMRFLRKSTQKKFEGNSCVSSDNQNKHDKNGYGHNLANQM